MTDLVKTATLTKSRKTSRVETVALVFLKTSVQSRKSFNLLLCFQAHLITRLPSTSNTNNMTVVRELCGNWESYLWICCHLLNQHLNIKIMLSEYRPECLSISHQVLTPVTLFLGFFLFNKNILTSPSDILLASNVTITNKDCDVRNIHKVPCLFHHGRQ